jgi:hypothetical protein
MQCITGWRERQRSWGAIAHTIAVLGLVLLVNMGCAPESLGGWVACPAQGWVAGQAERKASRKRHPGQGWAWRVGWTWLRRSWPLAALRSEVLLALVLLTERWAWDWTCLLPWLAWLWKGLGLVWPGLGRHRLYAALGRLWDRATGVVLVGLGLTWLGQHPAGTWPQSTDCRLGVLPLGLCVSGEPREASVEVVQDEAGVYHVRLRGEFVLRVDGTVEVCKRLLVIFLGLLEVPGETRGSRRTRDGRTPFVRQEQLAEWAGVPHPVISRWFGYWLN